MACAVFVSFVPAEGSIYIRSTDDGLSHILPRTDNPYTSVQTTFAVAVMAGDNNSDDVARTRVPYKFEWIITSYMSQFRPQFTMLQITHPLQHRQFSMIVEHTMEHTVRRNSMAITERLQALVQVGCPVWGCPSAVRGSDTPRFGLLSRIPTLATTLHSALNLICCDQTITSRVTRQSRDKSPHCSTITRLTQVPSAKLGLIKADSPHKTGR